MSEPGRRAILAGSTVSAAGFFIVSRGVGSRSGVSWFDQGVWEFFAADSSSLLESAAGAITRVGAGLPLLALAVVSGLALWMARRSLILAVAPWIAVQTSMIVVGAAKAHFAVERPPAGSRVVEAISPAFPSGHAGSTAAWATATVLVVVATVSHRVVRSAAVACAATLLMAVAWSRLELNVHWFSDVIGGVLLGASIGGFSAAACLSWEARYDTARSVAGTAGSAIGRGSGASDLDA